MEKKYVETIVKHYESCLEKHGDNHRGVDWPNPNDAEKRYAVMLGLIDRYFQFSPEEPVTLLDFGCGAGHLLDYIRKRQQYAGVQYNGLDISEKFVDLCREKYPGHQFYQADILDENLQLPVFDFIILNGVFTEKREMTFEEMWSYFQQVIIRVFSLAQRGIAFNVMSKAVDWEREDLFHMPADLLIDFMTKNLSRHFVIRNDYGLYEYTVYLYKKSQA